MTQEYKNLEREIIEGNKLIAAFLGYKWYPRSKERSDDKYPGWKFTEKSHPWGNNKFDALTRSNYSTEYIYPMRFVYDIENKYHKNENDKIKNPHYDPLYADEDSYLCRLHGELPFYKDWNWLHKVLNKITQVGGGIHMFIGTSTKYCSVDNGKVYLKREDANSDIKLATFRSIVAFITWYNNEDSRNQ